MATIKDVAKLAGVSVTTVSVVLNTKPEEKKVALKTRENVNRAIKILGYQPNIAARKLRESEDVLPIIAVFWPLDNRINFLGCILKNIKWIADQLYFRCDLRVYPFKCGELKVYQRYFEKHSFQAAFLGALAESDLYFLNQVHSDIPMVLYNRFLEGKHSVCSDNENSGNIAAELIKNHGGEKVSIFQFEMEQLINSRARRDAFVNACENHHVEMFSWVELPYDDKEYASKEVRRVAREGKIGDVCLFFDEITAYSALYALQSEGIRIPEQTKLLLLNTTSSAMITSYVKPEITRVDFDIDGMLQDCARILISSIGNPKQEEIHKVYQPKLILGDTF